MAGPVPPSSLQDQVDAVLVQQGADPREHDLLTTPVRDYGIPTSTPGANTTLGVLLDNGSRAFHKTFGGVNVQVALAYGHHPDQVPINECAAWRLAAAVGPPLSDLVATTVMWSFAGDAGALIAGLTGVNATRDPFTQARDQSLMAASSTPSSPSRTGTPAICAGTPRPVAWGCTTMGTRSDCRGTC